ncbi:MAG TPA: hypothetical protein VJ816_03170 [Gemmatimonadales bacterium]|nr:hypothetical protein [Gemmatimonadales bacterium]
MALTLPLQLQDGVVPVAADFMTLFEFLADAIDAIGGGTLGSSNQLAGVNGGGTVAEYKTLNGTATQLSVTHTANAITLALTAVVALATRLQVGTNAADSGGLGLANDMWITARNILNTANVNLLQLDATNRVHLGAGGIIRLDGQVDCNIDTTSRFRLPVGADKF